MWVALSISMIGLGLLGFTLHEAWTRRRIESYGIRVPGLVIGHVPHPEGPSAGGPYAVVSYSGEDQEETYTSSSSVTAAWPVGMRVRISYLPGKPLTTRIDDPSEEPIASLRPIMVASLILLLGPWLVWLLVR